MAFFMFGLPGGLFLAVGVMAAAQGEWDVVFYMLHVWLGLGLLLIAVSIATHLFMYLFDIHNVRTNAEREWRLGAPQRESRRRFNEFMLQRHRPHQEPDSKEGWG